MKSSLDEATGDMLELLPGLDQEITTDSGKLDWNTFPGVPCPDIKSRVPRSPMNCQEVEIRMKPRQDGVLVPVLDKVRCGRSKKVTSFVHQQTSSSLNVERNAHPYLPASENVLDGLPRPVEIMSATSSTLEYRQVSGITR